MVSAYKKNREKAKAATAYSEMLEGQSSEHSSRWGNVARKKDQENVAFLRTNPLDWIVDIREHDMPHHVRTSIDKELFVGSW